jgi:hypothetical protein
LSTLLPTGVFWRPTISEGEVGRAAEPHYAYGFLKNLRSCQLAAGNPVEIRFESLQPPASSVRVTLLPPTEGQLVLGENPSIREADEDDARLEEFQRPFMLLRRVAEGSQTTFVAVIEPFVSTPLLTSVRRLDAMEQAVVLSIEVNGRTDIIAVNVANEETIPLGDASAPAARFRGEVGVLSLRKGIVEFAYALGQGGWNCDGLKLETTGVQSAALIEAGLNTLTVSGDDLQPPAAGDVIRLVTADDWVYPYHIASASVLDDGRLQLALQESTGFEFDAAAQRLRYRSFPQREHAGAVRVEWQRAAAWARDGSSEGMP